MRYFTAQLFDSAQFYHIFNEDMTLENYLIKLVLENKEISDLQQSKEIYNKRFKSHVEQNFSNNLLFAAEMAPIIYDETTGEVKQLNDYIFFKLKLYAAKFFALYYEAQDNILEQQRIFQNNAYSQSIKKLSLLDKHDYHVCFTQEHSKLFMSTASGGKNEKYVFILSDSSMRILEKELKLIVLDEEIFINGDGTFEYNVLGQKLNSEQRAILYDISMTFREVEYTQN